VQHFTQHFNTVSTPQTEPLVLAKTPQEKMRSGGYGWKVTDWDLLDRFLIMGSEGGTYYASEKELTKLGSLALIRCIDEDGTRTVKRIVEISTSGRAPKNDPALYALAACTKLGSKETREFAYASLIDVARIGTHLFHFLEYCKGFGGKGGSGFKRALARWYNTRTSDALSHQLVKYAQRDGWSHRDVLRLAHPVAATQAHNALFSYACMGADKALLSNPENFMTLGPDTLIGAVEELKQVTEVKRATELINKYKIPHECVPNQWKNERLVWEALLPNLAPHALLRNLNKLTQLGILSNMSKETAWITQDVFGNEVRLRAARLHPITVLIAMLTYASGKGKKGSLTWEPVPKIIDALDSAFYSCFANVEPSNKRVCYAIDLSSSMTWDNILGVQGLNARIVAAAMSLILMRTEAQHEIIGFTAHGEDLYNLYNRDLAVSRLKLSPRMRLDDVVSCIDRYCASSTDCALPMLWALENKIECDAFVILTDNESWAGPVHVQQALQKYRNATGIPAKLIAAAFTADRYSVADPDDPLQLNVVGFDSAIPQLVTDFIR
jgi:60 kDa SS-A/Ro ribonucleoprotein